MSQESIELTGKQKRFLRGLANRLEAKIIIGHSGFNDNCQKNLENTLQSDELVKVRIQPASGMERKAAAVQLAAASSSSCVQINGNTVVLYRENSESKNIKLP
jgi:RNA-binding protein